MKTLNIFLALFITFIISSINNQQASGITNETVKIWGNCGMCQARIEKTAKSAGAITATWNEETKILSLSFDTSKTSLTTIEEKIAAIGHDTQHVTATLDAYNKLPGCCKYERKEDI